MTDDTEIFELRSYRVLEGKRDAFAEHVREVRMPIYNRIGWRCDGFWTPEDEPDRAYYMLRWASLDERTRLREVLAADPVWIEWKAAHPEPLVDDYRTTLMTRVS